ncbi:hypothetical protein E2K98_12770 [Bacillus salipaludis]|uniref:Uncharacterized protein n=1 Tax=Bacillus salipaludis TaxID=2547811 RepID=A0A4R5VSL9_9BACI|nr:hypothetical protein [Bacillus salipaludis]TDK61756.1 hypothetical protein E2K98_12770 [Bacillus salipaludis]
MVFIRNLELLEDVEFRSFIVQECNNYYRNVENYKELAKTNFVRIIALSQYGKVHELSLYAAIKREFKEIKFYEEVVKEYPIIQEWSIRYRLNPKTIILAVLTSILYEGWIIHKVK